MIFFCVFLQSEVLHCLLRTCNHLFYGCFSHGFRHGSDDLLVTLFLIGPQLIFIPAFVLTGLTYLVFVKWYVYVSKIRERDIYIPDRKSGTKVVSIALSMSPS